MAYLIYIGSMKPNEIAILQKIVKEKKWSRFDPYYGDPLSVEEKLNVFLENLNNEERVLYLKLLENYLIITEYRTPAKKIISKLTKYFPQHSTINVCALKNLTDSATKSGQHLCYELKLLKSFSKLRSLHFFDDPFSDKFQHAQGYRVIVDDFIGSGSQFEKMIEALNEEGLNSHFDLVASIVMQSNGITKITDLGYTPFSVHSREKALQHCAISDSYRINDALEKRIGAPRDCLRGYQQSEAIVSLKNTPNNTLPAFWTRGTEKWPAPFLRS